VVLPLALLLAGLLAWGGGCGSARGADFGETHAPMQVYWVNGQIVVGVFPQPNEGYIQIARRVMMRPERHAEARRFNGDRPVRTGVPVRFPLPEVRPELRGLALRALYPEDELTEEGWAHTVTDPLENLIQLTESYTGSKRHFKQLAKRNRLKNPNVLRLGTQILIPLEWIPDELGLRPPGLKDPLRLEKDGRTGKSYALYTLEPDDTLYALLIRFTDREQAAEINRLSTLLVRLNGLRGPERVRAGRTVRIPLEWISEEWLESRPAPPPLAQPEPDAVPAPPPRRPRAVARAAKPTPPRGPAPLHIIVDPGHGGKDPGAVYGSRRAGDLLYEHEVVYDIALRLIRELQAKGHHVYPTVRDPAQTQPVETLSMRGLGREELLVTPPYRMDSVHVAVNLRVYLIESIFRRLTEREGVPPERILLLSIHGDALAPTLRGTMIYFPDHRLRTPEFGPRGRQYRARREAAPQLIRYDPDESREAHEASRGFAELAIRALDGQNVRVSRRKPVRPFYYRDGVRTLPAVLRYSRVPVSVLVEVANLNNNEDRREMLRAGARQRVAQGLAAAVETYRIRQTAVALSRNAD
jgi:N-acetylmuramoyl-L-alanine amidase